MMAYAIDDTTKAKVKVNDLFMTKDYVVDNFQINSNDSNGFRTTVKQDGYTPLGIVCVKFSPEQTAVVLKCFGFSSNENKIEIWLHNISSNLISGLNITFTVLYVKN